VADEPLTRADRFQIELWRQAPPQRRTQIAGRLSRDVMQMARRAIAETHPSLDEWQQRVKFVEVHHGKELARRFARYLERRGLGSGHG
jgi:hypothetical protein